MTPDFSGYATRYGIECSDGLTIDKEAFKHFDGEELPLVWSHDHSNPDNVLGHVLVENRADGSYVYGFLNDTPSGKIAQELVKKKDIKAMSIYANRLVKQGNLVKHGELAEVSLVLKGANRGAFIEQVYLRHADGSLEADPTEAIIHFEQPLELALPEDEPDEGVQEEVEGEEKKELSPEGENSEENEQQTAPPAAPVSAAAPEPAAPTEASQPVVPNESASDETVEHADTKEEPVADSETETIKDVYDAFDEKQKNVVAAMIGLALENAGIEHSDLEGNEMTRNVFDKSGEAEQGATLSHSQIRTIMQDGVKNGSLKESFLAHAGEYGINDIDLLFPDARATSSAPELIARQADWVPKVLGATKHAPFAKIKSITADITAEEARAKGYIKGTLKKDEVVALLKRSTSPTTVYKKQRLDRDDIIDITDFDVIAWLKWEIRFMLNEEIARAILIGDGRSTGSEDKIKDPAGAVDGIGIRSILHEHELYAIHKDLVPNIAAAAIIDEVTRARNDYRGSGNPTFYTTNTIITDLLLLKDKMGRRLYDTEEALAATLRVKEIVAVEVMEEITDLVGIIVNLVDYTVGTNAGGELTFFDDFDIDFNQNKYLLETRMSGALTKPKSAIVIRRELGTLVAPTAPSFNGVTNTITVPTKTGVQYLIDDEVVTGSVVITHDTELVAEPTTGYYFPSNTTYSWAFTYTDD